MSNVSSEISSLPSSTFATSEAELENSEQLRHLLNLECYGIDADIDLDLITDISNVILEEKTLSSNAISTVEEMELTIDDTTARTSASATMLEIFNNNELLESIVKYIIKGSRLLFCHKVKTWQNFYNENTLFNTEEAQTVTWAELRDFFVKRMLPKIYALKFPEAWKKAFNLLELNEAFKRTPNGYLYSTAINYNSKINMPIIHDVDYRVSAAVDIDKIELEQQTAPNLQNDTEDSPMTDIEFVLETQKSNPAPPHFIVVTGAGALPDTARPTTITKLSPENRVILSTVVSYDYEIFHNSHVEEDEVLKRLKKARELFMKNGRILINLESEKLLEKVKKMTALRHAIEELIRKRF